jgi:hypothetical protein
VNGVEHETAERVVVRHPVADENLHRP